MILGEAFRLLRVTLIALVKFVIIGVVRLAFLAAELPSVTDLDVALDDLLLYVTWERHDIQASVAARCKHLFIAQLLALEDFCHNLAAVDLTPWEVASLLLLWRFDPMHDVHQGGSRLWILQRSLKRIHRMLSASLGFQVFDKRVQLV